MAASRLEAEDVECHVIERADLHGLGVRGAVVAVEAEQFRRAVEVLSATPARRCLLVQPVAPAEPRGAPAPGTGVLSRVLSRIRGVISRP
jgi:hypothetical protein